jgi:hypothetical protein
MDESSRTRSKIFKLPNVFLEKLKSYRRASAATRPT